MRISTQTMQRQSLELMQGQQTKIAQVQNQLATGKRIQAPSDDPIGSARALVLEREVSRTDQFDRNANMAQLKLSREEAILGNISNVLQNTRELAVQSQNSTYNADQRQMMSTEVVQNLQALIGLMNTQGESGEYIFGGYDNNQPPFSYVDPSTGNSVIPFSDNDLGLQFSNFVYQGDSGQSRIQLGDSMDVAVNDPGNAIFMNIPAAAGGEQSILQTLYQFGRDMMNNTLDPELLTNLDSAMVQIDITRSEVGTRLNAIEDQSATNADYKLFVQTSLSGIQDIDMAEAITDFNMQMTVLESIQKTYSLTSKLSLFNYI